MLSIIDSSIGTHQNRTLIINNGHNDAGSKEMKINSQRGKSPFNVLSLANCRNGFWMVWIQWWCLIVYFSLMISLKLGYFRYLVGWFDVWIDKLEWYLVLVFKWCVMVVCCFCCWCFSFYLVFISKNIRTFIILYYCDELSRKKIKICYFIPKLN